MKKVNIQARIVYSHSRDAWRGYYKLPNGYVWHRVWWYRYDSTDFWSNSRENVVDKIITRVKDYYKNRLGKSVEELTIEVEVPTE